MSSETLREITPFLTYFGIFAACIGFLDYVVRERHKEWVWGKLVSGVQLGDRPVSFAFYGLTTVVSVLFTAFILSVGGIAERSTSGGSLLIALSASGPMLIAVILKIVLLDYALALKTALAFRQVKKRFQAFPLKWHDRIALVVGALCDLFLTGLLTAFFLNWWEGFQMLTLPKATGIKVPPMRVFDEINFLVKESTAKSFYALNGTLFMYLAIAISEASRGALRFLEADGFPKHVFKFIALVFMAGVAVVATARA